MKVLRVISVSLFLLQGFITGCSEDLLGLFGDTSSSATGISSQTGFSSSTSSVSSGTVSSASQSATSASSVESFEYNGEIYTGMGAIVNAASPRRYTYDQLVVSSPQVCHFQADGFFTLRGINSDVDQYQYSVVYVTNLTTPSPRAYWFVRGNFEKRIWLPFGAGRYRVTVHKTTITKENLNYEGAISGWSYSTSSTTNGAYTFIVDNTRTEDGQFYYPSYFVQSDNDLTKTKASTLLSGITDASPQSTRFCCYQPRV
jgi:hypothetical protein